MTWELQSIYLLEKGISKSLWTLVKNITVINKYFIRDT